MNNDFEIKYKGVIRYGEPIKAQVTVLKGHEVYYTSFRASPLDPGEPQGSFSFEVRVHSPGKDVTVVSKVFWGPGEVTSAPTVFMTPPAALAEAGDVVEVVGTMDVGVSCERWTGAAWEMHLLGFLHPIAEVETVEQTLDVIVPYKSRDPATDAPGPRQHASDICQYCFFLMSYCACDICRGLEHSPVVWAACSQRNCKPAPFPDRLRDVGVEPPLGYDTRLDSLPPATPRGEGVSWPLSPPQSDIVTEALNTIEEVFHNSKTIIPNPQCERFEAALSLLERSHLGWTRCSVGGSDD